MSPIDYNYLMKSLCAEVGVSDPNTVLDDRCVEVDGLLVGLIHDELQAADYLSLYFDMGPFHGDEAAKTRLLEHNVTSHPSQGSLGISPTTGRLVYRANLQSMQVSDGASLWLHIRLHLVAARQACDSVLSANSLA